MINKDIISYIRSCLVQGRSKEDIWKELLERGWTVENIQSGFDSISEESGKEDTHKKTVEVILIIGAILIGAGIFSFIASNWETMSKALKVAIIVASMVLFYQAGWFLREKYRFNKTGEALILLGAITYGSGIFLVAQMFHIRANWPDGFILWMIGVIILAFALESYPLFYLAIPLGFAAVIGHPFGIFAFILRHDLFLLTSFFLLLSAAALTFAAGFVIKKKVPEEFKDYF